MPIPRHYARTQTIEHRAGCASQVQSGKQKPSGTRTRAQFGSTTPHFPRSSRAATELFGVMRRSLLASARRECEVMLSGLRSAMLFVPNGVARRIGGTEDRDVQALATLQPNAVVRYRRR